MGKKSTGYFIIGTFVTLYLLVSIISTIHVIDFFKISNPTWLAVSLAIAFEVGAAASLASLITLEKMNKGIVWGLFITLTLMQAMGNTYYAYTNLQDFQGWIELFGLSEEDLIYQKRVLSIVSGAILPIVALGFIKSLVDYIKPQPETKIEDIILDLKKEAEDLDHIPTPDLNIIEEPTQDTQSLDEENPIQGESVNRVEIEDIIHHETVPLQPIGENIESVNRHKSGYVSTDLDPTKIN